MYLPELLMLNPFQILNTGWDTVDSLPERYVEKELIKKRAFCCILGENPNADRDTEAPPSMATQKQYIEIYQKHLNPVRII